MSSNTGNTSSSPTNNASNTANTDNTNNASTSTAPPRRARTATPTRPWQEDEQVWFEELMVASGGVGQSGITWGALTTAYNARWGNAPVYFPSGAVQTLTRGPRTVDAMQQRFAPWWIQARARLDAQTTTGQPAINIDWATEYAAMLQREEDDEDPLGDLEEMMRKHESGTI